MSKTRLSLILSAVMCWTTLTATAAPVTVHNPWLVNDRVADTHNISTMGATYGNAYTPDGVVPPATNENKAVNIYNNVKRRLYHWANEPPSLGGNDINDPTYNQNVFGWCLCGRHSSNACTVVYAAGLTPRRISFPGHWTYEVQCDGLWHQFDTMCTHYVYTRTTPPHIASCQEIKMDNSLELNAVAEGRACPGYLLCGDTASGYVSYCMSWGDSGLGTVTARWTGGMDLRTGQVFRRTCESWANQYPTPPAGQPDPPFHHEAQRDYKDYVNFPYWEPYTVPMLAYGSYTIPTYRRWANGTDTLLPDFRSANYQSLLEPTSTNIATSYQDAITPDLHASAINTQGEAIFKVNVPFYITDANFSGDFTKATSSDVCKVYVSTNGTSWTQVYDAPVGTTHVANQSLRTNVFGAWTTWYIKIQMKGVAAQANAGVSNFVVVTTFEHNKGAMPYLDAGANHITLTFDNAAELAASGNCVHVVYKWKEYDGADWTIDKQYEGWFSASPSTFTINTGGASRPWSQPGKSYDVPPPAGSYPAVPRTEYILMEVVPQGGRPFLPISNLAAPPGEIKRDQVQLTWTAVDDGITGTASQYDLRYSTSPISDMASFDAATPVVGVPAPKGVGGAETFTVSGLTPATTYYFGIVVYNGLGNNSGLSNVVQVMTRKLGDIDGDGQVNLADLKLLVVAWNSQGGGTYGNWNPDADFDGDNNVNLSDLKILVAHWNQ